MKNYEKEIEVYNYVKTNAQEYFSVIVNALNDGIRQENERLRIEKSKVEAGIVVLLDKVNLSKLNTNLKLTLKDALNHCTFFVFDKNIKELEVADGE